MKKVIHDFKLLFVLAILIFVSCSDNGNLQDEILGEWKLKSYTTTCIPEDPDIPNETVLADESGCITTVLMDTSYVLTIGDASCSSYIFNSDGSVLVISGSQTDRDTTNFTYEIREDENVVVFCLPNTPCVDYNFDGNELSIEVSLGIISQQSDCKRLFVYGK